MSKIKKEQEPAYIFASFLIGLTITVSWLKFRGFIAAEWDLILLPVGFFFVSGVAFEFVRKMQGLKGGARFDMIKNKGFQPEIASFTGVAVEVSSDGGMYFDSEYGRVCMYKGDYLIRTKSGVYCVFDEKVYNELFE